MTTVKVVLDSKSLKDLTEALLSERRMRNGINAMIPVAIKALVDDANWSHLSASSFTRSKTAVSKGKGSFSIMTEDIPWLVADRGGTFSHTMNTPGRHSMAFPYNGGRWASYSPKSLGGTGIKAGPMVYTKKYSNREVRKFNLGQRAVDAYYQQMVNAFVRGLTAAY